ncbi:MAG: STAS domain-containing protein [Anaerolineales bacterium]
MLNFKTETQDARVSIHVLRITGDIDSSNFQTFQSQVDGLVAKGAQYILLDFSNVKRISSAGLRVIHNLFNKLRDLHKDVNDDELRKQMSSGIYKSPYLKLLNLAPQIAEIFSMSGFDIYIQTFDEETKALQSF